MNSVFAIVLTAAGLECSVHDIGVTVADATPADVVAIISRIAAMPPMDPHDIAGFVENLQTVKYDEQVPSSLLRRLWARANADAASQLQEQAERLLTA
jgi:ATP-dependent Lhr-like helicase